MGTRTDVNKLAELLRLPVFKPEGWYYLFSYGDGAALYARGNKRALVDRKSGRLITRYTR